MLGSVLFVDNVHGDLAGLAIIFLGGGLRNILVVEPVHELKAGEALILCDLLQLPDVAAYVLALVAIPVGALAAEHKDRLPEIAEGRAVVRLALGRVQRLGKNTHGVPLKALYQHARGLIPIAVLTGEWAMVIDEVVDVCRDIVDEALALVVLADGLQDERLPIIREAVVFAGDALVRNLAECHLDHGGDEELGHGLVDGELQVVLDAGVVAVGDDRIGVGLGLAAKLPHVTGAEGLGVLDALHEDLAEFGLVDLAAKFVAGGIAELGDDHVDGGLNGQSSRIDNHFATSTFV